MGPWCIGHIGDVRSTFLYFLLGTNNVESALLQGGWNKDKFSVICSGLNIRFGDANNVEFFCRKEFRGRLR